MTGASVFAPSVITEATLELESSRTGTVITFLSALVSSGDGERGMSSGDSHLRRHPTFQRSCQLAASSEVERSSGPSKRPGKHERSWVQIPCRQSNQMLNLYQPNHLIS